VRNPLFEPLDPPRTRERHDHHQEEVGKHRREVEVLLVEVDLAAEPEFLDEDAGRDDA
jgi:hypothetical protein